MTAVEPGRAPYPYERDPAAAAGATWQNPAAVGSGPGPAGAGIGDYSQSGWALSSGPFVPQGMQGQNLGLDNLGAGVAGPADFSNYLASQIAFSLPGAISAENMRQMEAAQEAGLARLEARAAGAYRNPYSGVRDRQLAQERYQNTLERLGLDRKSAKRVAADQFKNQIINIEGRKRGLKRERRRTIEAAKHLGRMKKVNLEGIEAARGTLKREHGEALDRLYSSASAAGTTTSVGARRNVGTLAEQLAEGKGQLARQERGVKSGYRDAAVDVMTRLGDIRGERKTLGRQTGRLWENLRDIVSEAGDVYGIGKRRARIGLESTLEDIRQREAAAAAQNRASSLARQAANQQANLIDFFNSLNTGNPVADMTRQKLFETLGMVNQGALSLGDVRHANFWRPLMPYLDRKTVYQTFNQRPFRQALGLPLYGPHPTQAPWNPVVKRGGNFMWNPNVIGRGGWV